MDVTKQKIYENKIIHSVFILVFLWILPIKIGAFEYIVTFTGSGAGTTVDCVVVQNHYKSTQVTVPSGLRSSVLVS